MLAAIDDDAGQRAVLDHAQRQAFLRDVPLRIVHVWARRRRKMAEADRLTSDAVAVHLPAGPVEREILHDADPARALIALSREGVLLVVAARPDGSLGSIAERLAGHTCCPLVLVPSAPVTRGRW